MTLWAQAACGSYDTVKMMIKRRGRWNKEEIQTISWQEVLDPSQQTLLATQGRGSLRGTGLVLPPPRRGQ